MALTGSMRDFGVSEILQLIGHQKKAGVLTVKDKKRKVEILFDAGAIVKAGHEPTSDLFDLGATLARSGIVAPETVEAAKQEAQRTLKPLPQILLAAADVELDEVRRVLTLIHQEIVYSLFLWKDGDYSFDQGAVSYPQQWTEPISSEGVLMDGYRIKDEWPLVESAIPDQRAKIKKVAGEFGPEDRLDPELDGLYRLVDGERTAEDLVFLSRMGNFEALKAIIELIDRERVTVAHKAAAPTKQKTSGLWIKVAAGALIAVGLFALCAGLHRNAQRLLALDLEGPGVEPREQLWALYKYDRVVSSLTVFAAIRGQYPESLATLVDEGELSGGSVKTPGGALCYQPGNDGNSCAVRVLWGQDQECAPAENGDQADAQDNDLDPEDADTTAN